MSVHEETKNKKIAIDESSLMSVARSWRTRMCGERLLQLCKAESRWAHGVVGRIKTWWIKHANTKISTKILARIDQAGAILLCKTSFLYSK